MTERKERWVEWMEPFGPKNEPVYMRVPESTAIAVRKEWAKEHGGHIYPNDEQALADFMTVNWAWFCQEGEGKN